MVAVAARLTRSVWRWSSCRGARPWPRLSLFAEAGRRRVSASACTAGKPSRRTLTRVHVAPLTVEEHGFHGVVAPAKKRANRSIPAASIVEATRWTWTKGGGAVTRLRLRRVRARFRAEDGPRLVRRVIDDQLDARTEGSVTPPAAECTYGRRRKRERSMAPAVVRASVPPRSMDRAPTRSPRRRGHTWPRGA